MNYDKHTSHKYIPPEKIKLEEIIKDGALSCVYKAKLNGSPCIVKVPTQGKEEGLEEEIKIYEELKFDNPPGLVKYLGDTKVDGKHSLVLEYFNGVRIENRIKDILSDEELQFKISLKFLHTAGYVISWIYYKDDFIRNVLINDSGDIRLIDFNFSKSQSIVNSLDYDYYFYDRYNDSIHVGDFIYFLFTGLKPHIWINKHVWEVNSKLNKDISKDVDRIILKCWNREYYTVGEVISDFNSLNAKRKHQIK